MLRRTEVMAVAPHERDQSTVLRSDRIDLFPRRKEVMVDGADDVKTIGDDAGLRKVTLHQDAVAGCPLKSCLAPRARLYRDSSVLYAVNCQAEPHFSAACQVMSWIFISCRGACRSCVPVAINSRSAFPRDRSPES